MPKATSHELEALISPRASRFEPFEGAKMRYEPFQGAKMRYQQ